MREQHLYESKLQYGSMRYNLVDLRGNLMKFFTQEAKQVFGYFPPKNHELWGFHKQGISIHMQTEYTDETKPENLKFVDVLLISEITPTLDLEERLKVIAEKSRKQERQR